jgi:HSP20 family molecular chaperone IbpA
VATTLPIKKTESIFDELEQMRDRIMHRAYDLFERRGRMFGGDLDDWLTAEHELVWKPPVEMTEKAKEFSLRIAMPGVDPGNIDIEVTPECLLLKAEARHDQSEDRGHVHFCEFQSGHVFRSIQFPKAINPDKVKAEFKNGVLHLNARIAEAEARKIESEAAPRTNQPRRSSRTDRSERLEL